MARRELFLRPHIHLCATADLWVLLDVKKDRYLAIPRPKLALLSPWLHGWTDDIGPDSGDPFNGESEEGRLAAELLSRGVLCVDGQGAKAVRPDTFIAPKSSLPLRPPSLVSRVWRFAPVVRSCSCADDLLRCSPFELVVQRVSQRGSAAAHRFELAKAAALIETFNSARLWYPRAQLCVAASLALLEFLARYDLFPRWRFGITGDPLHAHCWLQYEDVVLNDTVEHVSRYIPIMQV